MKKLFLALILVLIPSLSWSASFGWNFRSTQGFVTDSAPDTYETAENYPTTRNGITFGWTNSESPSASDRSNSVNARLAGANFLTNNNGSVGDFRVDLPATGSYVICAAFGDAAGTRGVQYAQMLDNSTVFATINADMGTNGFVDASNTVRTSAADWITNGSSGASCVTRVFGSTTFLVRFGGAGGPGSGATFFSHLDIAQSVVSSLHNLTLMGVGQ